MTKDVVRVLLPHLLLDLEGRVVNLLLPHNVRQFDEHLALCVRLGQHVGDHHRLAGFEVPHVDVVDVDDPIDRLELLLQFFNVDVGGRALHQQVVGVLDDGDGRGQGDNRKDVGGDGVEEVPGVPFCDVFHPAVRSAQEEDDKRRDDQSYAHDHVG